MLNACMWLHTCCTPMSSNLNIRLLSPSLHHAHKLQPKQSTGKHRYLWANPSYGVRQLQTLHVTSPCHLHTHLHTHTWRHTPRFPTTLRTLTISSFSHSLSLLLCMSFSVTRLVQNCTEASCHSIEE